MDSLTPKIPPLMKTLILLSGLLLMTTSVIASVIDNSFFAYSFGFPDMTGKEQVEFLSVIG